MSRVVVSLDQTNTSNGLKPYPTQRRTARCQVLAKQIARNILVCLLLPLVLSACAIEGDFGRPKPTFIDRIADELLPIETTLLGGGGESGVTEDEIAMREAGHRLSSPLISVAQGVAGPYGTSGLIGHPLAALQDELNMDHQALTQFGIASRRVLAPDSGGTQPVFEFGLNRLVENGQPAREHLRENISFIETTLEGFRRRLQAFYYAIEKIRPNAPDAFTTELKGSLNHLRDRSVSLEYDLTKYIGTAVARGEYQPPRFAAGERPRYGVSVPYQRLPRPAPYAFK